MLIDIFRGVERRRAGISLAELLVATALMSLLSTLAWKVLLTASRQLESGRQQLDLQRDVLVALNWLGRDISESSLVAIHTNSWGAPPRPPVPPASGPLRGIVMASPRDSDGNITFSGATVTWNSRICYYLTTGGELFRAVAARSPETLPPVIDLTFENTDAFATGTNPRRRLAGQVSYFNVERQAAGIEVTLETTSLDRRFTMMVDTLVKPRN